MKSFKAIHDRALARKGEAELQARMPASRSPAELAAIPDDRWLSAMARRVFSAGFVWRVIDAKWAGFEEAFHGFDPPTLADLPGPELDLLVQDTRIVRNRQKIVATLENARFVLEVAAQHGSFGRMVADWPSTDLVGLFRFLEKNGKRLGGDTGPRLLRSLGKPTFILTGDVVATLIEAGVVDKKPTSQKAMRAVQAAFDTWSAETGLDHAQLSMIMACSIDSRQ